MTKPFCRKCLLEELDPEGIYLEIRDMITALPTDKRTDDITYRSRLECCGSCEFLNQGTCVKCGCFVELRAAKKDMHCPEEHSLRKW